MIFDNRTGECAWPRPVGTRGGVGWMRGPCACPCRNATMLLHGTLANRVATRTSTRPPHPPHPSPCPYRRRGHSPIRSSKFIRQLRSFVDHFENEQNSCSIQDIYRSFCAIIFFVGTVGRFHSPIRLSKFIRTGPRHYPIRSSNIIRTEQRAFPCSVVKIYQNGGRYSLLLMYSVVKIHQDGGRYSLLLMYSVVKIYQNGGGHLVRFLFLQVPAKGTAA